MLASTASETERDDGHFVELYDDDGQLIERVADFVGRGLGAGEAAIVIATEAHRRGIGERLRRNGIDLETVMGREQFISIDAAETLSGFMSGGVPNEARFRSTVGRMVARASAKYGRLRGFGEMVALLSAEGNTDGAIRLEQLWNGLRAEIHFALYCAYPISAFNGKSDRETVARICAEHSHVLPPLRRSPRNASDDPAEEIERLFREGGREAERSEQKRIEERIRQAHEALRKAEEKNRLLAAIVESSDDAIVSKTLQGIITSWNRAAERIFGYTAAEIIGQSITRIIPADRLEEEPRILERIGRGQPVEHFETIRQRKDGTRVEISLTISPIRDANGVITGASKIARDITNWKKAERALAEARDELARANLDLEKKVEERTASLREAVAQMEEFSYTVSHDLRAPLRGMQVYSAAALEDYGETLPADVRHCIERIAENAARLDRMVQDVLTFSRVSREELSLRPISLDRLIADLISHYPILQPPRAEVRVEPLHEVTAHEPSLVQVMSNLLINAAKFVRPGETPRIRIWSERIGDDVRIWVEDNGIGIDPKVQHRLFRMFERLHPGLGHEGTGVGLAIARKAARRMRGEVGVESNGKDGSRFWLRLPRAAAA